ncbi:hypothetical protein LCGC14_0098520 [marine sediment metagenome]|uniref:DUF3080 domain-containing protein n=1 Tax=marine sediment metagenome TaxID=412755 RepID=A0A0F9YGA9_9ZZZZ|nr:DUF3080 family protein [Halomonas sp.]HDZ45735.1 DUF3080 family protein [Halomonas sp.]HEB04033.1 DUF3080 family protein [Halomonas sp.]
MTQRGWLASLLILSVALLVGCGSDDPADLPWETYHQQLADELSTSDIERTAPDNIDAFPERQNRLIDIPETRDSMLNVYALRECQITSLVAARNNQLGRVAPPSQQWLYERTLWQRLSACWNSDAPNQLSDENRARLHYLTKTKTAQLPLVSWNAIFDSSEWVKSFSRASQPLTEIEESTFLRHLAAIGYLIEMTNHQFDLHWQQDSSTLENHLKTLQERPLTAEVLRALLLATQRLTEANALLAQQSDEADACLSPGLALPSEHFTSTAQRWLSAINQLIDVQPVVKPNAIQEYQTRWLSLQNAQAPWAQLQQAKREHAALRNRFASCERN